MRGIALVFVVLTSAVAAGCGGSASTDTGVNATLSVSTTDANEALTQIASQAETVISEQVQGITSSTSKEDVTARLGEAQTQLESLADQLDNMETDDETLAAARDRLHDALHGLADQAGDLQESVASGDIQGAMQQLQSSDALAELQQAIQDIRAQSG
jgi:predicted nuclease with TOPRIM domain